MVVAVMEDATKCPDDAAFSPMTYASLLKVGAFQRKVLTPPNWLFFFVTLAGFCVIILLAVMLIGYISNRNWRQKDVPPIEYQRTNYSAIKRSDPKDKRAIVSINTEPTSF